MVSSCMLTLTQHTFAACAAEPQDKGSVTSTITIPATESYRVWSRVLAADTTNSSYYLDIDSSTCGVVVGGGSAIPANTWTWVDYHDGVTTNKIDVTLTAGTHTVVMTGKDANLGLDRLIFTGDTSCVPSGTGDNCANPPDTTPPVVALTTPTNGATVSGTTSISATATDDVAVAKVEFYIDNVLANSATSATSQYTYAWNTTTASVGSHTIMAKAYDTSGNQTSSTVNTVTVKDQVSPTVSMSAPTSGSTISGTYVLKANAADNVGVTKVEFYVDGTLKASDTTSAHSASIDTKTLTNASHSFTAKAYDAAGNVATSAAINATINNPVTPPPDTTPPTSTMAAPSTNGLTISGTYVVSATAADNVGVTKVELYVDNVLKNSVSTAPYNYSLDTTGLTNGSHGFYAIAYDAASNTGKSATITATVTNTTYLSADINQDGHVDLLDFHILASKFGQTGTPAQLGRADINQDSSVDLLDFHILATQFGQ